MDYAAAFAPALSGELRQARDLTQDLAREFPEDTFVQFMYLPTLRALFALNARDPVAGIHALQVASRYDLHTVGISYIGRFGALYPICVPGQAYLAARQPAEAVGEFQRILDHRSAPASASDLKRFRGLTQFTRHGLLCAVRKPLDSRVMSKRHAFADVVR